MDEPSTSEEVIKVSLPSKKLEICYVNGRFFASKLDAAQLESEARVCVNRQKSESEEGKKQKNSFNWEYNSNLCPILPELVAVLVEFGIVDVFRVKLENYESRREKLAVQEIPFENTAEFRAKRLTVRDFWRKGYFIAEGTRFGGHFLVYTSSPNNCHAEFVVLCGPCSDDVRISAMRCCNQVKKTLLLAAISSDSLRPHYTKCTWFRPELH